ncbi:YhcH/YjgK/YiaL family protein [Pontiella sp.]|uniref:YhcH/YjgK/YiaL family protein n=1 Tax=Pontiella sp. TaxID=2837462 RepID=UPI00356174DC
MILDTLNNAARYAGLKKELSEGFGFLDQPGLAELEDGRYAIQGDRIFAIVQRGSLRSVEEGKLEGHRNYIDIQYVIRGDESMGWSPRSDLPESGNYDGEKDLEFFEGAPQALIKVPPGSFAVFLPTDAHMPLIGRGEYHKVVVKVAAD